VLSAEQQAEILVRHLRDRHSARRIAKDLGIDKKSVGQIIKRRSVKSEVERAQRSSMLDPFTSCISDLLTKDAKLPATVILQRLREKGYLGGYTIVKEWVAANRPRSGAPEKEAFLMIDFAPGQCAQIDWGEFGDVFGDGSKIHCFVMVLCYSRLLYIEFTRSERFEDFIRCHERAFTFFGGCPEEGWYDNLTSAVTERLGKLVRFNARFFAYAGYHGFRAHACNLGKGNEKGRVEDGVKFVRNNFWPGRSFKDFHDLSEQARTWVTEIANRREHRATRRIPELVFAAEEKTKLAPLRPDRYETDEVFTKEVPPNFHLTYETNRYSVPWTMVGQVVTVKVCEDTIRVFYNERQITAHTRVYSKHKDISKDAHKQGLLEIKAAAKDGRAWQIAALRSLGPELGQYLDCLDASPRSLRYELSKLLALSTVYGADALCRIVASFLTRGVIGADQIELALKNSCQASTKPAPLTFQSEELARVPPKVDLRRYDALLFNNADLNPVGQMETPENEAITPHPTTPEES
jgi:transposase